MRAVSIRGRSVMNHVHRLWRRFGETRVFVASSDLAITRPRGSIRRTHAMAIAYEIDNAYKF
jgi:hypothetical protein